MKVNVLYDYSRCTDDELGIEAIHIIDKMTGNINFSKPNPTIEAVVAAKDDFIKALAACRDGGRKLIMAKNQAREILLGLLRALGIYVQANCNNDLNIALSSGFKTKKEKESQVVLSKPRNLKVEAGPFSASAKLSVDPVKGAYIYLYEWALAPVNAQTVWDYDLGKTSIIISNLVQGKEYAFRVAGKGAPESKVFSDIITRFIV